MVNGGGGHLVLAEIHNLLCLLCSFLAQIITAASVELRTSLSIVDKSPHTLISKLLCSLQTSSIIKSSTTSNDTNGSQLPSLVVW